MRFNHSGRLLLRLLDLHLAGEPAWDSLVDAVPQYSAETVAEAARACAIMWDELSHQLESDTAGAIA